MSAIGRTISSGLRPGPQETLTALQSSPSCTHIPYGPAKSLAAPQSKPSLSSITAFLSRFEYVMASVLPKQSPVAVCAGGVVAARSGEAAAKPCVRTEARGPGARPL